MDDLMAECIALKGFGQAGSGARGQPWSDSQPATAGTSSTSPAPPADVGSSEVSTAPWSPVQSSNSTTAPAGTAPTSPCSSSSSSSAAVAAAAAAAAAAVSVASNLPDGEYPPETASLRIIGEKYGCVIDVAGEIAADAAADTVAAAAAAYEAGRLGAAGLLHPVGSATPVGHQDVLIWGPTGAVGEAKDAVAALVSGNACAEVVVGIGRIQRRDRGFWVNCEVRKAFCSVGLFVRRYSDSGTGRYKAATQRVCLLAGGGGARRTALPRCDRKEGIFRVRKKQRSLSFPLQFQVSSSINRSIA